eukprot:3055434-Pleurochrysis_carterae.AAC.1
MVAFAFSPRRRFCRLSLCFVTLTNCAVTNCVASSDGSAVRARPIRALRSTGAQVAVVYDT